MKNDPKWMRGEILRLRGVIKNQHDAIGSMRRDNEFLRNVNSKIGNELYELNRKQESSEKRQFSIGKWFSVSIEIWRS